MGNNDKRKLFEIYELYHFFYENRDTKDTREFKQRVKQVEKTLGGSLKRMMQGLLMDITVLMNGDEKDPHYQQAFQRFTANYHDFKPDKTLRDYYWFLCNTYKIDPVEIRTAIEPTPDYKIPLDIKDILEDEGPLADDDVPF